MLIFVTVSLPVSRAVLSARVKADMSHYDRRHNGLFDIHAVRETAAELKLIGDGLDEFFERGRIPQNGNYLTNGHLGQHQDIEAAHDDQIWNNLVRHRRLGIFGLIGIWMVSQIYNFR